MRVKIVIDFSQNFQYNHDRFTISISVNSRIASVSKCVRSASVCLPYLKERGCAAADVYRKCEALIRNIHP